MPKNIKTEHSGAKNGGGHWGKREEAKRLSKKLRRSTGRKVVRKELEVNNIESK
jgi:hypothetical protein